MHSATKATKSFSHEDTETSKATKTTNDQPRSHEDRVGKRCFVSFVANPSCQSWLVWLLAGEKA